MRISGSVLDNEMHKPLWDFEKETNHLISARQPDLVIVNKKKNKKKKTNKENLPNSRLCRTVRSLSKIKRKQKER